MIINFNKTKTNKLTYSYLFLLPAKKCPEPVSPKNGRARLLYGGLRAEYQCNPGFMPMGTNYALCAEGRWTWEAPVCVGKYRRGRGCFHMGT